MSKPTPRGDRDFEIAAHPLVTPASARRKLLLYATLVLSGAALVAVIYLLRLDAFRGWEKSVVDLIMVMIAVTFCVSVYMAVDLAVKGGDKPKSGHAHRADNP